MIKSVRLGNLTRIRTGKLDANAATENGIYPFFTCSKQPLSIDNYAYDCECVLVAGNGDLNVKYYSGRFEAYQRTYIIESLDASKLMVKYLYYFLEGYVETLRKQAIGGVIKYIKLGNLTEAVLPLPSIDVQREIVDRIEKCDDMLSIRHSQLDFHDQLVKSRFIEMFGEPVANTKCFEQLTMKTVCKKITDGEHGSVRRFEKGRPFLNAKHIKPDGTIDWSSVTYTSDEVHQKIYRRCNPESGDILMTTTGTIGNVAVVPESEPFSMDRGITLMKLDSERVLPVFIAWQLRFDSMQNIMKSNVHASAIGHLFLNKVEQLPIIVPEMELQEQFAAFVQATDKSKYHSSLSLEHCLLLAKHIQKRKMTCQTLNF